jgi:hypothetical protein
VDPNPPVLQRLDRTWSPPIENAPVVYALMLDLHLSLGSDCAGTKAQVASRVRSTLITPTTPGLELPLLDISPGCRQAPDRHFDPNALDVAIQGAERTYGSRHVRVLLVYVNNINLTVPETLQSDFAGLRILMAGRGAPLPIGWAMAVGVGQDNTLFARFVDWRYAGDPAMFSALAGVAAVELPFQALGQSPPNGVPLFTPQEAAPILEFKVCTSGDTRITPTGFQFDGKARRLDPAHLPTFSFAAPDAPPVMRSAFVTQPIRFSVEACTANCDHFARLQDGTVAIWDRRVGCILTEGSVP